VRRRADGNAARPLILASVMLAMFMTAIEGTIVSTAMPTIVSDLGGFSLYSWVFSAFLLAQAATIPIYGKLADLFGRKPVFLFGAGLFLFGSLLCGLAQSMIQLIAFRLLQGLGAGAVQPIVMTIVGDIYSPAERGRIQGYLSSVWGTSSILGPVLGGLIVQHADWAYIFWLNLPLGLLAMAGMGVVLREPVAKKRSEIDVFGSAFMFVGVSALMLFLIQGGVAWPWLSWPSVGLFVLFLTGLVCFLWQEMRVQEPMMPLGLWKHPVIGVANVASLVNGMLLMGVSTYLPAYIQGVMGQNATVAGFSLSVMSLGWPLASTIAGRVWLKWGSRNTALLGGLLLTVGAFVFVTLHPDKGPLWAALGSFVTGAGMGFCNLTFTVSIQSSVPWSLRGTATASHMFMRTLGSTVGAALLGGLLNNRLLRHLREQGVDWYASGLDAVNALLDPFFRQQMPLERRLLLAEGLAHGLHTVYVGVAVLAVVSLCLVCFLPQRIGVETAAVRDENMGQRGGTKP